LIFSPSIVRTRDANIRGRRSRVSFKEQTFSVSRYLVSGFTFVYIHLRSEVFCRGQTKGRARLSKWVFLKSALHDSLHRQPASNALLKQEEEKSVRRLNELSMRWGQRLIIVYCARDDEISKRLSSVVILAMGGNFSRDCRLSDPLFGRVRGGVYLLELKIHTSARVKEFGGYETHLSRDEEMIADNQCDSNTRCLPDFMRGMKTKDPNGALVRNTKVQ
jgi:hypothetical protein